MKENIKKIKSLNLDVLVDTKGFTGDFEMAYSSSRPAPVVVNFLAYPGSMGSTAYDYIIGDKIVTPFDHQKYFSECIAQMPNAYQPNDPNRFFPSEKQSKSKEGLPEDALVLAAALLHKSEGRRDYPSPRRSYAMAPTGTVLGRPSCVKRLSRATRTCNSTT